MIKRIFVVAFLAMILFLMLPNLDYDSGFRLHIARDYQLTVLYIHGVSFLPLYQFVMAMLENLLFLRLFSLLCVLFSGFLLYKIMKKVSSKVAVATTGLFMLNPLVLLYGTLAMSESLATLLMMLMLYCYMKEQHVGASVALSLGVFTAYWFWVFIPFYAIKIVKEHQKRWLVYVLPMLGISAWVWWNWVREKSPIHFVTVSMNIYNGLASKVSTFSLVENLLLYTIIFPVMFLAYPLFVLFKKEKTKMRILDYFIGSYTALLTGGLVFGFIFGWARYFIPLIPVYLIIGAPAILKSKYGKVWILAYFVIAIISTVWQAEVTWAFQKIMIPS